MKWNYDLPPENTEILCKVQTDPFSTGNLRVITVLAVRQQDTIVFNLVIRARVDEIICWIALETIEKELEEH